MFVADVRQIQAYEFCVESLLLDVQSGSIWADYIAFVKVPAAASTHHPHTIHTPSTHHPHTIHTPSTHHPRSQADPNGVDKISRVRQLYWVMRMPALRRADASAALGGPSTRDHQPALEELVDLRGGARLHHACHADVPQENVADKQESNKLMQDRSKAYSHCKHVTGVCGDETVNAADRCR